MAENTESGTLRLLFGLSTFRDPVTGEIRVRYIDPDNLQSRINSLGTDIEQLTDITSTCIKNGDHSAINKEIAALAASNLVNAFNLYRTATESLMHLRGA